MVQQSPCGSPVVDSAKSSNAGNDRISPFSCVVVVNMPQTPHRQDAKLRSLCRPSYPRVATPIEWLAGRRFTATGTEIDASLPHCSTWSALLTTIVYFRRRHVPASLYHLSSGSDGSPSEMSMFRSIRPITCYFAQRGVQSIAMSTSVCLSVCPLTYHTYIHT